MSEKRKILTYFDFACPFCYNEWMFMKKVRPHVELEEDFYFWEIHPEAPQEGMIADWPGRDAMVKEVNALGAPVGIQAGNTTHVYNTQKALRISEEARKQGLMHEYMDAVFHAYFEEKINVSEDDIILGIANKVGIKGAEAVLREGRYLDLVAEHDKHCMDMKLEYVPTIVENGKIILSGVLSLDDVLKEFLPEAQA